VTNVNFFNVPNANTVSVINTATNTVVATIPVGVSPSGVAVTPDGTRAYVTNAGSAAPNSANVSVINTATNTVVATIPVGTQPTGVVFTPDGTRAYVTNFVNNTVSVINTATNTVTPPSPSELFRKLLAFAPTAMHCLGPGSPSKPIPQVL
jgi:YVTN family beta-propeller protein